VFYISRNWVQDLIAYLHTDEEKRPSEIPLLPEKASLNDMKHGQDYYFVGSNLFLLFENKFGRTSERAFDKNRVDISIIQGEIQWPLNWPLPFGFEMVEGQWNKNLEWVHLLIDFDSLVNALEKVCSWLLLDSCCLCDSNSHQLVRSSSFYQSLLEFKPLEK
jgi:hypothetical protein